MATAEEIRQRLLQQQRSAQRQAVSVGQVPGYEQTGKYLSYQATKMPTTAAETGMLTGTTETPFNPNDYVKLAVTNEWVSKADYDQLTEEQQAQLTKLGIEGYQSWFTMNSVKLNTGEWIGKTEYSALSAQDQAEIMKRGVEGFNQWKESVIAADNVKIGDTWVNKTWYNSLTAADKTKLAQVGYQGFMDYYTKKVSENVDANTGKSFYPSVSIQNTITQAEVDFWRANGAVGDQYIQLATNIWVPKNLYDSLSTDWQYSLRSAAFFDSTGQTNAGVHNTIQSLAAQGIYAPVIVLGPGNWPTTEQLQSGLLAVYTTVINPTNERFLDINNLQVAFNPSAAIKAGVPDAVVMQQAGITATQLATYKKLDAALKASNNDLNAAITSNRISVPELESLGYKFGEAPVTSEYQSAVSKLGGLDIQTAATEQKLKAADIVALGVANPLTGKALTLKEAQVFLEATRATKGRSLEEAITKGFLSMEEAELLGIPEKLYKAYKTGFFEVMATGEVTAEELVAWGFTDEKGNRLTVAQAAEQIAEAKNLKENYVKSRATDEWIKKEDYASLTKKQKTAFELEGTKALGALLEPKKPRGWGQSLWWSVTPWSEETGQKVGALKTAQFYQDVWGGLTPWKEEAGQTVGSYGLTKAVPMMTAGTLATFLVPFYSTVKTWKGGTGMQHGVGLTMDIASLIPIVGWLGKAGKVSARTLSVSGKAGKITQLERIGQVGKVYGAARSPEIAALTRAGVATRSAAYIAKTMTYGGLMDMPKALLTHPLQTARGLAEVTVEPFIHPLRTASTIKGIAMGEIQLGNFIPEGALVSAGKWGRVVPVRDASGKIIMMNAEPHPADRLLADKTIMNQHATGDMRVHIMQELKMGRTEMLRGKGWDDFVGQAYVPATGSGFEGLPVSKGGAGMVGVDPFEELAKSHVLAIQQCVGSEGFSEAIARFGQSSVKIVYPKAVEFANAEAQRRALMEPSQRALTAKGKQLAKKMTYGIPEPYEMTKAQWNAKKLTRAYEVTGPSAKEVQLGATKNEFYVKVGRKIVYVIDGDEFHRWKQIQAMPPRKRAFEEAKFLNEAVGSKKMGGFVGDHEAFVEAAMLKNIPIPDEVLAGYPKLMAKYGAKYRLEVKLQTPEDVQASLYEEGYILTRGDLAARRELIAELASMEPKITQMDGGAWKIKGKVWKLEPTRPIFNSKVKYPIYVSDPTIITDIEDYVSQAYRAYSEAGTAGKVGGTKITQKDIRWGTGEILRENPEKAMLQLIKERVIQFNKSGFEEFYLDPKGRVIPLEGMTDVEKANRLVHMIKKVARSEGFTQAVKEFGLVPVKEVYPYVYDYICAEEGWDVLDPMIKQRLNQAIKSYKKVAYSYEARGKTDAIKVWAARRKQMLSQRLAPLWDKYNTTSGPMKKYWREQIKTVSGEFGTETNRLRETEPMEMWSGSKKAAEEVVSYFESVLKRYDEGQFLSPDVDIHGNQVQMVMSETKPGTWEWTPVKGGGKGGVPGPTKPSGKTEAQMGIFEKEAGGREWWRVPPETPQKPDAGYMPEVGLRPSEPSPVKPSEPSPGGPKTTVENPDIGDFPPPRKGLQGYWEKRANLGKFTKKTPDDTEFLRSAPGNDPQHFYVFVKGEPSRPTPRPETPRPSGPSKPSSAYVQTVERPTLESYGLTTDTRAVIAQVMGDKMPLHLPTVDPDYAAKAAKAAQMWAGTSVLPRLATTTMGTVRASDILDQLPLTRAYLAQTTRSTPEIELIPKLVPDIYTGLKRVVEVESNARNAALIQQMYDLAMRQMIQGRIEGRNEQQIRALVQQQVELQLKTIQQQRLKIEVTQRIPTLVKVVMRIPVKVVTKLAPPPPHLPPPSQDVGRRDEKRLVPRGTVTWRQGEIKVGSVLKPRWWVWEPPYEPDTTYLYSLSFKPHGAAKEVSGPESAYRTIQTLKSKYVPQVLETQRLGIMNVRIQAGETGQWTRKEGVKRGKAKKHKVGVNYPMNKFRGLPLPSPMLGRARR